MGYMPLHVHTRSHSHLRGKVLERSLSLGVHVPPMPVLPTREHMDVQCNLPPEMKS